MGAFTPPAGLGAVVPQSPTQGVVIYSSDQLLADVLIGKTIYGGVRFDDTLGGFYPVVIKPSGGFTLNGSNANLPSAAITFHNTNTSMTDELLYLADSQAVFIVPNLTTSVNTPLIVADRRGATYLGWALYPALTSGGTTQPEIDTSSPPGTANAIYRFGPNYIQIIGAASGSTPTVFAIGTDTNINLGLSPKGTGVLQTGYATTALGGGAAPTLGTIGASGPANVGQFAWLKIATSNAAAVFIPVWT